MLPTAPEIAERGYRQLEFDVLSYNVSYYSPDRGASGVAGSMVLPTAPQIAERGYKQLELTYQCRPIPHLVPSVSMAVETRIETWATRRS